MNRLKKDAENNSLEKGRNRHGALALEMHDDALGSTHSMEVSRAEGTKHTQAQRLPMAAASHHNLVALLGTGSIVHSHPALLAGLNA